MSLAQEARESDNNYVLEALYSGVDNERTAGELGDIMNSMYASPLYPSGAVFSGAIVYEKEGSYVFRD